MFVVLIILPIAHACTLQLMKHKLNEILRIKYNKFSNSIFSKIKDSNEKVFIHFFSHIITFYSLVALNYGTVYCCAY